MSAAYIGIGVLLAIGTALVIGWLIVNDRPEDMGRVSWWRL